MLGEKADRRGKCLRRETAAADCPRIASAAAQRLTRGLCPAGSSPHKRIRPCEARDKTATENDHGSSNVSSQAIEVSQGRFLAGRSGEIIV